jgi:hypothetical protein
MSFLAVWVVFRDPAIDHRLVVVGALLPDLVDAPTGGRWVAHTLVASVAFLVVVMLGTRGRRLRRRQLLALPIGTFLHLVLDGMWTDRETFWWPFLGGISDRPLPSVERGLANVILEVAGAAVLVWAYRSFRFDRPDNRSRFLATGRLPR